MSRKNRERRGLPLRRRKPASPSRGQERNIAGDGGFHHWKLETGHDVHISDGIPFHLHEGILDIVERHLSRGGEVITDRGFLQSGFDVRPTPGKIMISTDPQHNETWVWRVR